jgi:hypothetical protein
MDNEMSDELKKKAQLNSKIHIVTENESKAQELHKTIDWIIEQFENLKTEIDSNNSPMFHINTNQSRDIRPMRNIGFEQPTHQEQVGPVKMVITVDDWTDNGKEF